MKEEGLRSIDTNGPSKIYQESSSDILDEIENVLEKLGPELADFWEKKQAENKWSDREYFSKIKRVLEARKAGVVLQTDITKNGGRTLESSGLRSSESLIEYIHQSIGNKANLIGFGNIAEVYVFDVNSDICLKVIKNKKEYKLENDVYKEVDFLNDLAEVEVEGVRVSKPDFIIDETNMLVIGMERLYAISLRKALDNGGFPETFDIMDFSKSLLAFMVEMHRRHIYHMDLHTGNIMVDLNTGKPRVIDFGKSVRVYLEEDEDARGCARRDFYMARESLKEVGNKIGADPKTYLGFWPSSLSH